MKFPNMFSPVQIGTVTVPNRFVVPPMGNDLANTDGSLSERSLSYYQARAKGGFGLITIESTVEKDSELGGNFRIASYPTGKGQISEAIRSMIVRAKQAGVNIRLNTEATEEPLRALAPNAVILATGSVPLVLPIPGLADCGYVTAQDLLLGKTAAGRRALVVGGGMVGCEAAEYLAERGHQVAIVEMKDVIAADVTPENRRYMFRNFEEDHVLLQPGAKAPRQCRSGHRRRPGGGAGHLRPTEPANYDVLCLGVQRKGVVQNGENPNRKVEKLLPEERLGGNGLFARITVFPGREIDYHEHHGETETYPIIAGEGVYSDNGAERAIHAGDTFFCDDGGGHGIRNTGADDLVFIALIIRK